MMKNPSHPSELLREDVIKELGLSFNEAAEWLGISRVALSRVLNGKAAMSANLAIRLEMSGVSTHVLGLLCKQIMIYQKKILNNSPMIKIA